MTTQFLLAQKAERVLPLSVVELFSFLLPVFLLCTLLLSTVSDATAACPPNVIVNNISQGTINGQCCYKLSIAYDCWYVGPNPPPGICSVYVHGIDAQPIKRTYLNHFHILDFVDYCIMPGTSRTISVEAFDCNGALVYVYNTNVSCPNVPCPPGISIYNNPVAPEQGKCCFELSIYYDLTGEDPMPNICSVAVDGVNGQPLQREYLDEYGYRFRDYVRYCIPPGSSRTVSVYHYDCDSNIICSFVEEVECPVEECCDGIFINHVWTSLDQCCGEFTIQWNPETQCDAHEVRVIGAYYNWDQSIPGYRVPYCTTPGIPKVIRFETYDSFGNLICEEERTVGCPAYGENGPHFKQGDVETPGSEKSGLVIFPNPTSGVANVSYTLPHTAIVRLEVIDALGQPVALLDEGMRPQGIHTLTYSTQELASGMYQLKLTYGDVVVVQPLVVSK